MHNQTKLEENVLEFWKGKGIYKKAKERNKEGEAFFFCDGPPYATGQIHPGTAWNKCLKDAVCRYKRMRGYNVRAQPGYDTHGLPIEVKVEQEMKIGEKKEIEEKIGIEKFVGKCREFATRHIEVISGQFERCGVWMDFENPYITYKNSYIESAWKTIKAAHEKGLLSRGVYVLPYCTRCQTTLANYELEYADQTDPSIYVKFKVKGKENEYLVIWTTTPWTLVSNMAVMAHPTLEYVKAKVGDEVWVVAKERLDAVMAFANSSAVVLSQVSGKKLEGTEYELPLAGKIKKEYNRKMVLSDEFVSVEDGSGLVHCAPGHGPQDFIIGKRFDIEIFSPIDAEGKFTQEAGEYEGMDTQSAGKRILEYLDEVNALVHSGKIVHRYPHCWRCKTKLIYLTTDQWFITVSRLKERMMEEIEKCNFTPSFAKTRFSDFVRAAPDWCISRQRYWGIPLPIWICEKCAHMKVVGSASELPIKLEDLHRPQIDTVEFECEKCKGKMKRIPDILDVWFDSGNAVWAQFEAGEALFPANVIIEGKDQTRGWFYSLLGSGLVLKDCIPYSNLVMHGFFVDEKGEKMSKSVGNFVPLEEIMKKNGSDAFRLWCLSSTIWDDLRFNWDEIREASVALGILYNLGAYLQRFYPDNKLERGKAEKAEDAYIISRLNETVKECTGAFEEYRVHDAAKLARRFVVEDLSRFYLKIAKKRTDEESLAAVYECMLTSLRLLCPIAPCTCEAVYGEFFKKHEKEESVHFLGWPAFNEKEIDAVLEKKMMVAQAVIAAATNARQKANVKLRWPLEKISLASTQTEVSSAAEELSGIICEMANVKQVEIGNAPKSSFFLEPNFAKIGEAFKGDSKAVIEELGKIDAKTAAEALSHDGKYAVLGKYEVNNEMVGVKEEAGGYSIAEFEGGKVYLKTEMSKELLQEAYVREVARRVQQQRKGMKLVESDKVTLEIACRGEIREILERGEKEIVQQVNASSVEFVEKAKGKESEEFEIEGEKVGVRVKKD